MLRRARSLAFLTAALLVAQSLAAETLEPLRLSEPRSRSADWRAYRKQLQSAADAVVEAGVPGLVAYVRDGKRTLTVTSGLRDAFAEKRMRKQSRFRIASITKTFIATALLQLQGEGALDLDDAVEDWLPGMVPNGSSIDLRHLLNHTSGISDFEVDPDFNGPFNADPTRTWTPEELVAIAVANPPAFEPGTTHSYSNTNYVLAGLVLEAVTNSPVGDLLERQIFKPLGLHGIAFEEDAAIPGKFAHGYRMWGDGSLFEVTSYNPTSYWSAGNIAADARSVARFFRALLTGRVIEAAQLQEMKTFAPGSGGTGPSGMVIGHGLGLIQNALGDCEEDWWGAGGWLWGYLSIAASSEDASRQVVMMVNTDSLFFFHEAVLYEAFNTAWCGLFP